MYDMTARKYIPNLAIAITTFKRQELLQVLLESIAALEVKPKKIFVVDNENSPETKKLVKKFALTKYIAMPENTGGAGGFSRGVDEAYMAGYDWIWVMDDDVKVLPGAIEKLSKWTAGVEKDLKNGKKLSKTTGVFQGQRKNFDDTPFYWQYHFLDRLAMPNPIAPSGFKDGEVSQPMNTACFEGGLFHRLVVEKIGLPDARFFIYWDDTTYGYLASKVTQMRLIPDFILQRTRSLEHLKVGKIRKLNSTSDMTRYYIMRNRGHMAHYLHANGDYNAVLFGAGTMATFAKETIRLFVTKNFRSGLVCLWRGWRDGRKVLHDKNWRPFSSIEPLKK
jgi:GT2 family glycosyltransferase